MFSGLKCEHLCFNSVWMLVLVVIIYLELGWNNAVYVSHTISHCISNCRCIIQNKFATTGILRV